jgi:RimJ/RimL family protein N-acetyltransferase
LTLRAFCRGHNPIVVNLLKKLGFEEQEFTGTYLEYTNG